MQLGCIPQVCGDPCLALCLASTERLYWLREELCTPGCIYPKSSVEVPCVGVLCGQVSENPSV